MLNNSNVIEALSTRSTLPKAAHYDFLLHGQLSRQAEKKSNQVNRPQQALSHRVDHLHQAAHPLRPGPAPHHHRDQTRRHAPQHPSHSSGASSSTAKQSPPTSGYAWKRPSCKISRTARATRRRRAFCRDTSQTRPLDSTIQSV